MDAQILFLGLMMFCVDGSSGAYSVDCPLVGAAEDPPGRVYLVDATDRGKWCKKGVCRACPSVGTTYKVDLHVPYLVVEMASALLGEDPLPACDEDASLGCWDLRGKKLTFEIETKSKLKVSLGRKKTDPVPPALNQEKFYEWLASMNYFDSCTGGAGCFGNLDPIGCVPQNEGCRVATWVDLAASGTLSSALIGRNGKDINRYSEWERDDGTSPTPLYTALADGALWSVPVTDSLRVCDQDQKCVIVGRSGNKGPRVAVVNLPEGFLNPNKKSYSRGALAEELPDTNEISHAQSARGPEAVSKEPETLDHFRMYYQLYKDEYSDSSSECAAPRVREGSSSWKPDARLRDWLTGRTSVHLAAAEPPVKVFLVDGALCPPSKFP